MRYLSFARYHSIFIFIALIFMNALALPPTLAQSPPAPRKALPPPPPRAYLAHPCHRHHEPQHQRHLHRSPPPRPLFPRLYRQNQIPKSRLTRSASPAAWPQSNASPTKPSSTNSSKNPPATSPSPCRVILMASWRIACRLPTHSRSSSIQRSPRITGGQFVPSWIFLLSGYIAVSVSRRCIAPWVCSYVGPFASGFCVALPSCCDLVRPG